MDNNHHNEKSSFEQIKSAQTMITIATIAAPVSLIFGGVLLSAIAFICGPVGRKRLLKVTPSNAAEATAMQSAAKSVKMALIMCVIALSLNLISAYMMYPAYIELLQTAGTADISTSTVTTQSSIWG
ncbi:MAG: hypothetical protein IKV48_05630 [Eggerthellaceae bacterium]|nr:hypothetical protein [Eggerthellaceae bacterium]